MKLGGITNNNHRCSVERRNLGITNGGKTDNLLTKRQKDAIDMRNGDAISSSQDDGHASVILLGCGIPVESYVPPINLPKVEKIPPYTTWIFLDRCSCLYLLIFYSCVFFKAEPHSTSLFCIISFNASFLF